MNPASGGIQLTNSDGIGVSQPPLVRDSSTNNLQCTTFLELGSHYN